MALRKSALQIQPEVAARVEQLDAITDQTNARLDILHSLVQKFIHFPPGSHEREESVRAMRALRKGEKHSSSGRIEIG